MRNLLPACIGLGLIASVPAALRAEDLGAQWPYSQAIHVPRQGVVQALLPLDTLSNAHPTRQDLRLIDPSGQEMSYIVHQPKIEQAEETGLEGMMIQMTTGKTVITGRVPPEFLKKGFDAIYLFTVSDDFLKPVTVEGSRDQTHWTPLVKGYPLFKQPGERQGSTVEFPRGAWPFLRLTLDDSTTPPIRIQGVRLYAGPKRLSTLRQIVPVVLETASDSHQTEIQLLLPADNLTIDSLRLETAEKVFQRRVAIYVKTYQAGEFRDRQLGQGVIYGAALNQKTARRDTVLIGQHVPGRMLSVRIENGDSRPLAISRITADVVPAYLAFNAQTPGTYTLWSGNLLAEMKNYDVGALRESLPAAMVLTETVGPLAKNPAYQASGPLPHVQAQGTDIDLSSWRYRKKITLRQEGVQRVEPDLQVLAHNGGRLAALRVVQEGRQLPYVIDHAGISREIAIPFEETPAEKTLSRWTLTLPEAGLPVTLLRFAVPEVLFQRTMRLYEDRRDERGDTHRVVAGEAAWVRSQDKGPASFTIVLYRTPQSQKLFLETDNRDNPPIHLSAAKASYQTPRLVFKADPGKDLYLYYGNEDVAAPQYDLNLVAAELLAVPPAETALSDEEILKVRPWWQLPLPSQGGMKYVFWALMGLVVIVLLAVIAKLLPEEPAAKP